MLEFPGTADGPWRRYIDRSAKFISHEGRDAADADSCEMNFALRHEVGTVRYPRVVPRNEDCARRLKKRTLTNLYNLRPTWLALAHRRLDEAVFAAYGRDAGMSDDRLLAKLLEWNRQHATVGADYDRFTRIKSPGTREGPRHAGSHDAEA